jgi:CRISPR-associated endonuclease/helicase Cas3
MELKKLGGDVFHLSTSMCPLHRLLVLDEVRRRLNPNNPEPCYLVATQLIEAGVDVDFPFLMRELAPLEAIIQAAGRCDREGRLTAALGSPGGQVMVFRSVEGAMPSDRWYNAGRSVLETSFLNAGREPQIDAPDDIREYFERLYRTGHLDQHGIQTARGRFAFGDVARDYRLIDNDGDPVVVASWKEKAKEIEALMAAVRSKPTRGNFRKLAPYQVNLRRYERNKLDRSVTEEVPGLFVWRGGYDAEIGLTADNVDTLLCV